jgi:chemotaxis protein methyltransferase WspC
MMPSHQQGFDARQQLVVLLEQRIGLDWHSLGESALEQALESRRAVCQASNQLGNFVRVTSQQSGSVLPLRCLSTYLDFVCQDRNEFDALVDTLSVPESWFFRDESQLQAVVAEAQGLLRAGIGCVRILCLPCARGEEAYSLAIMLREAGLAANQFQIDAFDLNERFVVAARRGEYSLWSLRGREVPELYLQRNASGVRIRSELLPDIRFATANAVQPNCLGANRYHIACTRNMLIYLSADAKRRWLSTLKAALESNALIIAGHAEALNMFDADFLPQPGQVYYRKAERAHSGELTLYEVPAANPVQATSKFSVASLATLKPAPKPAQSLATPSMSTLLPIASVAAASEAHDYLAEAISEADRGDLSKAERAYERYCQETNSADRPARAYYLEALLHSQRDNRSAAKKALETTLYLQRDHQDALVLLSCMLENDGDIAGARRLRERLTRVQQRGLNGG